MERLSLDGSAVDATCAPRLLIEAAEDRWRYVNGAHLVALVRAGAKSRKGVLVESEVQEGEVAAQSAGRADPQLLTGFPARGAHGRRGPLRAPYWMFCRFAL